MNCFLSSDPCITRLKKRIILLSLFILHFPPTHAKGADEKCVPNCGENEDCIYNVNVSRFECSCRPGFVPFSDGCHSIWTENLEAKVGLILEKAREPRYRRIYKGSHNDSDLIMGGIGMSLKGHVSKTILFFTLYCPALFNSVTNSHQNGGLVFPFFILTLPLESTASPVTPPYDGGVIEDDEDEAEVRMTCPYATTYNSDTNECNLELGEPCMVSENRCGLNTECFDGKCACQRGDFSRAFNKMDCWSTEDLERDGRSRFDVGKSWRRKDNPENRRIECKNNPEFSPKCPEVLEEMMMNGTNSVLQLHQSFSSSVLLLTYIIRFHFQ